MERHRICAPLALVALALFIGCGHAASPVEPTPLSVSSVPAALQDYRLSGGVRDSAWRPLSGAKVEVIDGPRVGTASTTDEAGRFSLAGTFTGYITISASKDGYVRETRPLVPPGRPLPPGNPGGGWEMYFSLDPVAPSVNIAGVYTLTLTAASACSSLPEDARTRTYTASVAASGRTTTYLARLSDARFLSIVPCTGRPPE